MRDIRKWKGSRWEWNICADPATQTRPVGMYPEAAVDPILQGADGRGTGCKYPGLSTDLSMSDRGSGCDGQRKKSSHVVVVSDQNNSCCPFYYYIFNQAYQMSFI